MVKQATSTSGVTRSRSDPELGSKVDRSVEINSSGIAKKRKRDESPRSPTATQPAPTSMTKKRARLEDDSRPSLVEHDGITTPPLDTTDSVKTNNVDKDGNPSPRIYVDGIFDLFHFGHAESLRKAKNLLPNATLVVGVCNDELTHRLKGKTVMVDTERAKSLRHCRWVDEVIENAPWTIDQEYLNQHNIDYVAHGDDAITLGDGSDCYAFVKAQGRFLTFPRTDGVSTSELIRRIVCDYDVYLQRNLSRGYSGRDLNIGYMKEQRIKMKSKMKGISDKVKGWSEGLFRDFLQGFTGESADTGPVPFAGDYDDDEEESEDDEDDSRLTNSESL
eukprot:TRINITY_DN13916_c0_g1_i1.p1 TRINITY_DN13916_c0_g1~~TRINITY_DN13916_c0_g1_i1.p1  ORF type:complete len:333 (-),score=64.32 TRINITY_DN13916_c0_g1_i1:114-1112(-)